MKLVERTASILQDFELRQLEIEEVEKFEGVEEKDQEFQPEEDCAGVTTPLVTIDEMKLVERIASILQDFELRQLEIEEVEKFEGVEEKDQEFQPEEDCAGVTTPLVTM
ncbi:unnamed protein product [Heligmosomoides polygyrus]|uniref:Uncharacterized protein n=1 Tax=Heligmosomoides polygyrus TaxID=6339 RepID=A0A183F8U9_HELPZ|nr:unnamed protein product [Heligmosomoides polygyrus]